LKRACLRNRAMETSRLAKEELAKVAVLQLLGQASGGEGDESYWALSKRRMSERGLGARRVSTYREY